MIVAHHSSEREAARVLAVANMAGFDVLNACFDAKFAYYLIRPSQADPLINLPVGLPNHPSYPSGHSCITSAYATVLASAFPDEGSPTGSDDRGGWPLAHVRWAALSTSTARWVRRWDVRSRST